MKIKEHNEFVTELMDITGLSFQYSSAAFFTIEHWRRERPIEAAKYYKEKFDL